MVQQQLDEISKNRILILDGAMGTMVQRYNLSEDDYRGSRFKNSEKKLAGCNDLLCLTRPDRIALIHEQYLGNGADIIETCSFNANAVSLADYGLQDLAYEINKAAAEIARAAADKFTTPEKPRFVAGVLGPCSKSASISPDMDDPAARSIAWDELEEAYYDNARGLLDGGADILLIETIFDGLNAKAAIAAIMRLFDERNMKQAFDAPPIMISAAISDAAGRLLAGQTVEAFCISMMHAKPWSIGLNCSLGAELLKPYIKQLNAIAPCRISAHPNAGLPDELGAYTQTPEIMAAQLQEFVDEGLVNVIGGCCGSTPDHIAAIAKMAQGRAPRPLPTARRATFLSGLDALSIPHGNGLVVVGERGNAPGSKIFLDLIMAKKYDEALRLLRKNIEDGARIIDICMDDGLLDGEAEIVHFIRLALSDPDIARVPFVVDSSRFSAIEAALKCIAGKVIANSISLKEGEADFLQKARIIRRLGAALVVMLFDEEGQAADFQRKVSIATRSYNLLVGDGFPPEDIIIDPNILAVATGMTEHDRYALDFIRAIPVILKNCPHAHVSAGVSNLSFSFRGNWAVRNAIHAVFLKYAQEAGLSIAIVNIAAIGLYEKLDPPFRETIADMLLCRKPDASETLLAIAQEMQERGERGGHEKKHSQTPDLNETTEERVVRSMIKGIDDTIAADVIELAQSGKSVLQIVEGPLMEAMRQIGDLFGEGKMFLPQVIRSARVMKKAVAALDPFLPKPLAGAEVNRNEDGLKKIILATVKGDVHDIGKNIVGTVLACSGYKITDLGVMVPAEKIIETALQENAAAIGLSGLVSPSLDEMMHIASLMEQRGLTMPLLIGGAAASLAHTALKIAPAYSGPVVYVSDAGRASTMVRALFSAAGRDDFLRKLAGEYEEAVARHNAIETGRTLLTFEQACQNRLRIDWTEPSQKAPAPRTTGIIDVNDYPLERVMPRIDWDSFLRKWMRPGNENSAKVESTLLLRDAKTMLDKISQENTLKLRGTIGIFHAMSKKGYIIIKKDYGKSNNYNKSDIKIYFLRNQLMKKHTTENLSLVDFLAEDDYIGLFALSAGFGLEQAKKEFIKNNDDYNAILMSLLADSLAEAFSEEIHERVRNEWWGCGETGIRPAFGYPCCPDHQDKRAVFEFLDVENRCGMTLTESAMIQPVSSVCGMYFANPAARYFSCGKIGEDQLADWAAQKNISVEEARKRVQH